MGRVSLTGDVLKQAKAEPAAAAEPAPVEPPPRRRASAQRQAPARQRPPSPAPEPPVDDRAGKPTVIVYLAGERKAAVLRDAAAAGLSVTDWVLDALDRWWERLPDMFAQPTRRQSPLPARARNRAQPAGEGTTTLQLRVTEDERRLIDERAAELSVASRSAFLARVITAEIGDDPQA